MQNRRRKDKIRRAFARVDEAIRNAKPTQIFANVAAKQIAQKPLENFSMRYWRDWGKIANQIVGAE